MVSPVYYPLPSNTRSAVRISYRINRICGLCIISGMSINVGLCVGFTCVVCFMEIYKQLMVVTDKLTIVK